MATDLFTFQSREYILIADSYSGFFDFRQLRHTTTKEVVEHLKSWFATHGIPAKLESDNGPQYASMEFRRFASDWGFQHSTSSPKYPKSNGLAERFVQTAKQLLRKCTADKSDVKMALLVYRNTPRSDALGSPSQRLMSRATRSIIPVDEQQLKPKVIDDVSAQLQLLRDKQKEYHDKHTKPARELAVGDQIRLQQDNRKWIGATVLSSAEKPRSFMVRTDDGSVFRRNTSQLHPTRANIERSPPDVAENTTMNTIQNINNNTQITQSQTDKTRSQSESTTTTDSNRTSLAAPPSSPVVVAVPATSGQQFSRFGREIKKVQRYNM